jgi:catechol 2,3-dioxygenase-like lactoylglutathione lyase family enzyme
MTRLAIVVLATERLEPMAMFYHRLTGWPRAVDVPVFVELDGGGTRLAVYDVTAYRSNLDVDGVEVQEPGRAPPSAATGVTRTELYLEVADVAAAMAVAQAMDAPVLSPARKRAWGQLVGFVADPDGNVVGLAQST